MNVRKIVKKHDRNRVLAGLSYLAGFPLFILLVFIGSVTFFSREAFGSTKYYGLIVCLAIWLVVSFIQLIAALVTKNYSGRAIITVLFTLIIMVGGSVFFDIKASAEIDKVRTDYVRSVNGLDEEAEVDLSEYTVPIKNFKYQINHYVNWTSKDKDSITDDYNEMIDEFKRVYNVKYQNKVKGKVNTDGSEYGEALEKDDGTLEYWFGETDKVYKENGLYADGYIFSIPVATEILITYYETQNYYASLKKDADEELAKALIEAENSSAWKNYKKTEEYKNAYGENGICDSYMVTPERLDAIIGAIGDGLYEQTAIDLNDLNTLISFITTEFKLDEKFLRNLSLDSVLELVGKFGITITEEQIIDLLAPFSNYEVSNVKPLMYFIKDERLRNYAYACYFGETHGANIGSVLIPNGSGKIGGITMTDSGYTASENAFTLNELYLLRAYNGYIPKLFPLFAVRRYAYIFAGIISLMMVIFYYARMKVKFTGRNLERIGYGGGVR